MSPRRLATVSPLIGLAVEGRARRRPVLEGAGLEVEVERLAVRADGRDAVVLRDAAQEQERRDQGFS
jgi:hypothetical protein